MPATSAQVDALKKFIAQGEVYFAVGKPATSFTSITFGTGGNAQKPLKIDGSTPADSAGITSGPVTLEYKPDFKGVEIEQGYGEVAPRVTKESVTLKFKCAEATYARLKEALTTGTLVSAAFSAGNANPTTAPTAGAPSTGGLANGTWLIAYAWRRTTGIGAAPGGTTMISSTYSFVVSGGNGVVTMTATAPPAGYTLDWYLSESAGSTVLRFKSNTGTGTFVTSTAPSASAATVPTANYTANPGSDMLQVGGKTFFPTQCIAVVSDLGTFNNGGGDIKIHSWVALYEAISVDGIKLEWKRGETRMIDVTITGYADVTREEGDQLYQIGELQDPTP